MDSPQDINRCQRIGLISLALFIVTFLFIVTIGDQACPKYDGGEIDSCPIQGKLHTAAALGNAHFAAMHQVQLGARIWPAASVQDESTPRLIEDLKSIRLLHYAPKTSPPRA